MASLDNDSVVSSEGILKKTAENSSNHQIGTVIETSTKVQGTSDGCNPRARKKKKIDHPKPDPTPGRCHFFVERKSRYCKVAPHKDKIYCTEHSHEMKVSI